MHAAGSQHPLNPFMVIKSNAGTSRGTIHPTNCNIAQQQSVAVNIPQNQTQIQPTASPYQFTGLAYGVQNYTCSQAGNYTNIGAVAELIDVSCFTGSDIFLKLPDQLYASWYNASSDITVQDTINIFHDLNPPEVLAQHYFIPNPAGGLSPKWDFTSSGKFQGKSNAFIVVKGKGSLPSPNDPSKDINWLDVVRIDGDAADEVLRTDTRGGQPPSSCTPGQSPDISVKYVSFYHFFGGKLGQ
ncbi:hypothetical protein C8Q75DRAFT_752412 [Abortiporus biennis]|nr:hypothetical protein C8Q75DRAFT_752412 [Abortiporus biennis]